MIKLPERIKERRKSLGMTLLQLAEKTGVKEATAQRWESGSIKTVKYETIELIADALNCSPVYLMGWSDDPYFDVDKKPTPVAESGLDGRDIKMLDMIKRLSPDQYDLLYAQLQVTLGQTGENRPSAHRTED